MLVFDLDGTLVDTRAAVEAAYSAVGVRMPSNAWGKPWKEWLKDEELHRRKNAVYPIALALYAKRLPLMEHCLRANARVITGASREAVRGIKRILEPRLRVVLHGASLAEKIAWLSCFPQPGVYVDDSAEANARVALETGWRTLLPYEAFEQLSIIEEACR
jgi:hypothetical protein